MDAYGYLWTTKTKQSIFLENISLIADNCSSIYDKYIFLRDFNMEPNFPALTSFMQSFNLFKLIKTSTNNNTGFI